MPKPHIQYAIKNPAGLYYKVVNNSVMTTSTPTFFTHDMVDWQTLSVNYKRDMLFLGVIRKYAPDRVRFSRDAARILRYIHNTQGGAAAEAYFVINTLNSLTQMYELLDYWQFDFSMSNNQELYYEVAIMEGGYSELLKGQAATNFDVPLNDPALAPDYPLYNSMPADELPLTPPLNNPVPPPTTEYILMDGMPILNQVLFVPDSLGEVINTSTGTSSLGRTQSMGLTNIQTYGDYSPGVSNNPILNKRSLIDSVNDASIYRVGDRPCRISVAYNLAFHVENLGGANAVELRYQVWDGSGGGWGSLIGGARMIWYDMAFGDTADLKWRGQYKYFDLPAYSILSIGFEIDPLRAFEITLPATDPDNPTPCITLNVSFIPESSIARAIPQYQLFQYLAAMIATKGGKNANIYSSYSHLLSAIVVPSNPGKYDIDPTSTYFTCGDSLRGLKTLTITDPYFNGGVSFDSYIVPAIHTNMNDFAKDLLVNLCAGIGIERTAPGTDRLVAEHLYYFFDDSKVIVDLGENISNFRMEPFNDYRGSSITIGQTDQQFDAINGPLETMSEVTFTTPLQRVIEDVDFKTPYREDPYGIELTRANVGNKTNINSSSDNDTFKIHTYTNVPIAIDVLDNWNGLSGFETGTIEALRLFRADVSSGLPSSLLSPGVGDFSMYNLAFSPKRKALRTAPWLCSNYRGLVDSLMGISGKKKNIMVTSDLGSGPISESDWINVGETSQSYTPPFSTNEVTVDPAYIPDDRATNLIFKPYLFSFTSEVPINLPVLMTPPGTAGGGKMYGKVKFTFVRGGDKFPLAGFAMDIGITPGKRSTYNYKLLCSPTVDIPPYL